MKNGYFITLEGIEGAGKSTQVEYISDLLKKGGHEPVITREPGGTETGEAIRNIVLNGKDLNISPETELLLIFAARAQHVNEVILPAMKNEQVVLCDRFTDATYAYQGGGRGIKRTAIAELENQVQGELRPDLTLLFDVNANTGLSRAKNRSEADRFESETISFFEKVRAEYLAIAEQHPQRVCVINGELPVQDVRDSIREILERKNLC